MYEYLILVYGIYGSYDIWGYVCVWLFILESNCKKYGLFGVELGICFLLLKLELKVIGFYGKVGFYLDVIGVYF